MRPFNFILNGFLYTETEMTALDTSISERCDNHEKEKH